jgi:S1-C subfamily serine protease
MKRYILALILALSTLCVGQEAVTVSIAPASTAATEPLASRVYKAVTLLYSQDESGGMHMHCTATAYKKTDKGYRFVTASHCVPGETEEEQKDIKYFITADAEGEKTYIKASLVAASDKTSGEDFAIFQVDTQAVFSVIPLGDNTKLHLGSPVIDVAGPLGLGKQFFQGYVSNLKLDRPKLDAGEIQWKDVMLVMIGSGPGSSGSSIVSEDQKAIVGFLVGGFYANIGAICVPVEDFKTFETKVDAGTYGEKSELERMIKKVIDKDKK